MENRIKELFKDINIIDDNKKRVLIIDGTNRFIAAFSAFDLINESGYHIGGLYGFLASMCIAIRTIQPDKLVITFDGKDGSLRRKKIYSDYKAHSSPKYKMRDLSFTSDNEKEQSMIQQFRRLIEYLDMLPVQIISLDNIEADDVIAYLITDVYTEESTECYVMSTDKDFLQLINDRVFVWHPQLKKIITKGDILKDYFVTHHNYIMYKVLVGDVSDNVKGIRGIGRKTASKYFPILNENRVITIDDMLQYAKDHQLKYKIYENILKQRKLLEMNFKLMQLSDVNISGITKLKIQSMIRDNKNTLNRARINQMFKEDGLLDKIKDPIEWINKHFLKLSLHTAR
jgi:DNA polymerase-1